MIGLVVGPYRILEQIGQGGMGVVYRGIHTQLDQEVAIKVLSPAYVRDPAMRQRFIAEARLQAKLTHPHVVNIFNYLEQADHLCLIMEHVHGPSLQQRLATEGRLAEHEAVSIGQSVLAALSFMHSKGVIHRDIKPGNILFTEAGLVKVTDFGIAKMVGEEGQTRTGMRLGTPWYMAPEHIQGQPATVRSDLYSLGVTLYEMVTGNLPFKGDSEYSIMRGHIEEAPVPPWEVQGSASKDLGHVILKALEKKPERRYQSAREFSEALAKIAPRSHKPGLAPQAPARPQRPRGRALRLGAWRSILLFAGPGLLLAMLAYVVFFHGPGKFSRPPSSPPSPQTAVSPTSTPALELDPVASAERVKQWLDSHPEVLPCAKVSVVDVQAGVVTLGGRVVSEAQRTGIRRGVQDLDRGIQVKDAFHMIPWPFCEVLDLLEPLKNRNEEQAMGLTAKLDKQGDPPLYYHNDNFIIAVKAPTMFESYVYVDYYSTDETVGHLFPNAAETSNRLKPNGSYTVGQLNGPQPWSITPPFGRDLVTVIASKAPLFAQLRPASELARTYLKDLRQALARDGSTSDLAATYYFIQTQERP